MAIANPPFSDAELDNLDAIITRRMQDAEYLARHGRFEKQGSAEPVRPDNHHQENSLSTESTTLDQDREAMHTACVAAWERLHGFPSTPHADFRIGFDMGWQARDAVLLAAAPAADGSPE